MPELARLRTARAKLWEHPAAEARVIAALDRTLELWAAPDSEWRARLGEQQTLYSAAVLELGLVRAVEHWTAERMRELRARELPPDAHLPAVTALWLAGSIPPAMFQAMLLPLLAGSALLVKPPSSDPHSPELFAASIRAVDPGVADCIAITHEHEAFRDADALIAYGRDETLSALRGNFPDDRPFVGHGHKLSVAAVGRDAELEAAASAVALDAALWDGRGCLSPAWVWIEDRQRPRTERFCSALARALARLARELPRGTLSAAEQAWVRDSRARMAVRDGSRVWTSESGGRADTAWTIALEARTNFALPGMLRTLSVVPVPDAAGVLERCSALAPHLSCIGHCGWGTRTELLEEAVQKGMGSRLCPSGTMQLPSLDWKHDGHAALASLRLPTRSRQAELS